MAIGNILRTFGLFYDRSVHFVFIWYIIFLFWYHAPRQIWQPCFKREASNHWTGPETQPTNPMGRRCALKPINNNENGSTAFAARHASRKRFNCSSECFITQTLVDTIPNGRNRLLIRLRDYFKSYSFVLNLFDKQTWTNEDVLYVASTSMMLT
jgi:hypothetical protein